MNHIENKLPELALGQLSAAEQSKAELHLSHCAKCSQELAALQEALTVLVDVLPPVKPPSQLRENLLQKVAAMPFAPFEERVSALMGLDASQSKEFLQKLDQTDVWVPGSEEGISFFPILTGKWFDQGAFVSFVRIAPGVAFPKHKHFGEERTLVLQGGYRDQHSIVVHAGEQQVLPPESLHSFVALDGPVCIGAVVVENGLEFFETIGPTS